MPQSNLCLHTGANAVDRDQVAAVPIPPRTRSWVPLAHHKLLEGVQNRLQEAGLSVVSEAHGLTRDGARYFGLLQVVNGHADNDFGLVIGLRNSHDKSFPAGLVVGASVFVCDNLSFSGEIKLARKHTVHVERDLPNPYNLRLSPVAYCCRHITSACQCPRCAPDREDHRRARELGGQRTRCT